MKTLRHKNYLFFLCLLFSCQSLMVPQTSDITQKYFPDPELDIRTPAFKKEKGFTNYAEMMAFLESKIATSPDIFSMEYIGKSQKGLQIPLIHIGKPGPEKVRIWMQGGLHGNEPAGTEAMLYLMDKFTEKGYQGMLDRLYISMVPMANIDGYQKQDRYSANGLDLNRDQTKIAAPETRSLKQAFSDFAPHICLDFHEYRPYRRDFNQMEGFGVTNAYDVMFLYTGNLNVPNSLRDYTQNRYLTNARSVLLENQISFHDYFTPNKYNGAIEMNLGSIHARSTATSAALTNCVSTLIEIRGVGLNRVSFKRRIYSTWLIADAFMRTAFMFNDELFEELAKSQATLDSAYVKQIRSVYNDSIAVIELEHNERINIPVVIHDALNSHSVLTRIRPAYYLIPASETAAIERLHWLGIETIASTEAKTMKVQSYHIKKYSQDGVKWEEVLVQHVSAELKQEALLIPAGTHFLRMDQKNANLAIELLEPEANNSFVSMNIIPTKEGATLPYYRVLTESKNP